MEADGLSLVQLRLCPRQERWRSGKEGEGSRLSQAEAETGSGDLGDQQGGHGQGRLVQEEKVL